MPANYPLWDHQKTPHTDPDAKPSRYRQVKDVTVIELIDGNYRGAVKLQGMFEMVNLPGPEPRKLWGEMRAEVYCAWHGVRPLVKFPQVIVGNNWKVHRNYSGKVIDNIS